MTYVTNLAAVYFEQKDYEKCVELCKQAIDIGRENRADFKLIAKAYTRIGNSYKKLKVFDIIQTITVRLFKTLSLRTWQMQNYISKNHSQSSARQRQKHCYLKWKVCFVRNNARHTSIRKLQSKKRRKEMNFFVKVNLFSGRRK
jgi:hypothetical protein